MNARPPIAEGVAFCATPLGPLRALYLKSVGRSASECIGMGDKDVIAPLLRFEWKRLLLVLVASCRAAPTCTDWRALHRSGRVAKSLSCVRP